ncbi:MAG: hypothetical protein JNK78_17685 [Planctomycetes bacterium]|nr:hypothetical protein [Planctomycetota bacterium]
MDGWRDAVRAAIRADSKKPAEQVAQLLGGFRERGEVPESLTKLRAEQTKLRAELIDAYDAFAKAVLATDERRGEAIVAEKSVWKQVQDAVEWTRLGAEDLETLNETAAAGDEAGKGTELKLPITFEGGYRLEVRGRRVGDGAVHVRLPRTGDVDTLHAECPGDRFAFRVTVSPEGRLVIDEGAVVQTKVTAREASAGEGRRAADSGTPIVLCVGGSLRIESVRWKPFVLLEVAEESVKDAAQPRADVAAAAAPFGSELVVNGGNERSIRNDGSIEGWTVRSGSWHRGNKDTLRYKGGYFSSSAKGKEATPAKTAIYQDVDLQKFASAIDDGVVTAHIAFAQQSFDQAPGDLGRVTVEFLDATGQVLAGGYDSEELCSRGVWKEHSGSCSVPKGARTARVMLQSRRPRARGQDSSDAHFDEVSLKLRKS